MTRVFTSILPIGIFMLLLSSVAAIPDEQGIKGSETPDEVSQRETMDMIRKVGIAFMAYLGDQTPGSVSSGSGPFSYEEVRSRLRPSDTFFYMDKPPQYDAWGNPLEFWVNSEAWPDFQLLVRSPGRDGVFESEDYKSGTGENLARSLVLRSYDSDIVFIDGYWSRPPSK